MRLTLLALLMFLSGCTTNSKKIVLSGDSPGTKSVVFNVPDLLTLYQQNNQRDVPVISYMIHGTPQILIYADGRVITKANPRSKSPSGLLISKLPTNDLNAILNTVGSMEGFYSLSNRYRLSSWSEMPLHDVSVRLANRPEKTVYVYGMLEKSKLNNSETPVEFRNIVATLLKIHPEPSSPWDPGYVEVDFADYSYAPGISLQWPTNWPSLTSPLVRNVHGRVIKKIMIFPSKHAPELDEFLKNERELGATLIDDWKASVGYRWSLPGEKYWTSWDQ